MSLNCSPFTHRHRGLVLLLVAAMAVPGGLSAPSDFARAPGHPMGAQESHVLGPGYEARQGNGIKFRRIADSRAVDPPSATPTPQPDATSDLAEQPDVPELIESQLRTDHGDVIRRRVFTVMVVAAGGTACLLVLLWAYASLRDPYLRRRASLRLRQERREERRSRHRRQEEQ